MSGSPPFEDREASQVGAAQIARGVPTSALLRHRRGYPESADPRLDAQRDRLLAHATEHDPRRPER